MSTTHAAARKAAREDGLLDERLLAQHPKTWPHWARLRYIGDEPLDGGTAVTPGPTS